MKTFFLLLKSLRFFFFFLLGKICGYELSLYKHDDIINDSSNIPFIVELNNEQAVIKVKSNIIKLDCEIKQVYRLFIRAYDCADENKRRYSERYEEEKKKKFPIERKLSLRIILGHH